MFLYKKTKRVPRSGQTGVYNRLPFGWNLSPALCQRVTSEMAEILRTRYGLKVVAYIDDFGLVCDSREEAVQHRQIFIDFCERLGIRLSPWKQEGPTRCMQFLGLRHTHTHTHTHPRLRCWRCFSY